MARNGQFRRLAKSAGVRRNPHEYAGTGAIRQEKTPTENGWGFNIGGGWLTKCQLASRAYEHWCGMLRVTGSPRLCSAQCPHMSCWRRVLKPRFRRIG